MISEIINPTCHKCKRYLEEVHNGKIPIKCKIKTFLRSLFTLNFNGISTCSECFVEKGETT